MLPPLLSQGVSPSLRRSSTASINITPVLLAGRAVSLQQARSYSWWQSNTAWLSKLDPEFHRFSAKRAAHCRAELLKSLRRRSQLIRDTADQETSSWGWRRASTWGKPGVRWSRSEKSAAKLGEGREKQDDYDLSGRELRWREKMEDMKRRIEEDPYTAVFGKQFAPFWSPLRNRSALSEDTQSQRATGTEGTENAPETAKPKPHVSSTCWSFSSVKEPGSASPVLKATATTWNSSSNDSKRYEYDPITMRMIPIQAATEPATPIPETRVEESRSADLPVKTHKAKLSPAENSASPLKDGPTQDLVDAPSTNLAEQSGQMSPLSAKTKPVKPIKPAALSKLPNDDLDLLTADAVRASMGKTRRPPKETEEQKLERKVKLERAFDSVTDSFKGLETVLQRRSAFAKKLDAETTAQKQDMQVQEGDACSHEPVGLQTSFANETRDHSDVKMSSLEMETGQLSSADDGYTQQPVDMQTSYTREVEAYRDGKQQPLEEDMRKIPDKKDGYVHQPTGMQTPFTKEVNAFEEGKRPSLEHEVKTTQHEGDVSKTVNSHANSNNWYQQTYWKEKLRKEQDAVRHAAKRASDQALVREVREIYEKHYGTIDATHCQPITSELEGKVDHDIPQTLEVHDKRLGPDAYAFRNGQDTLESELSTHKKESSDVTHAPSSHVSSVMKHPPAPEIHPSEHTTDQALDDSLEKYDEKVGKDAYRFTAGQDDLEAEIAGRNSNAVDDSISNGLTQSTYVFDADKDDLATQVAAQERETHESLPLLETPTYHDASPRIPASQSSSLATSGESDAVRIDSHALRAYEEKEHMNHRFRTRQDLKAMLAAKADSAFGTVAPSDLPPPPPTIPEQQEAVSPAGKSQSTASGVAWHEPAVYKVLAYDSGNDIITTATTTSNLSDNESAISISSALSQLYQPARFIPHFASLQSDGYQVIYSSRDLLIFKKVREAVAAPAQPVKSVQSRPIGADESTGRETSGQRAIQPSTDAFASRTAF
ncbi:hypothetical protein LTR66_010332, partial [Elasticomyces elasticus]